MSSTEESTRSRRQRVTPEAFEVDPSLLDTPLAKPSKRLWAILLDLLVIGIVSSLGFTFFCFVACLLFIRESIKAKRRPVEQREDILRHKPGRMLILALCTLALFLLSYSTSRFVSSSDSNVSGSEMEEEGNAFSLIFEQRKALDDDDPAVRANAAESIVQAARKLGLNNSDIDDMIEEFPKTLGLSERARKALIQAEKAYYENLDNLKYQESLGDGSAQKAYTYWQSIQQKANPETIDTAREELKDVIAGKDLNNLKAQNQDLVTEIGRLEEESQKTGHVISYVKHFAEDLGLQFGWSMFYFMALPAFFKGKTVGKRLVGIQIIRLDGKSLSLWNTFERAGAYSAGLATGLLGFAQIWWDPNRQAVQDKIAGTVVIKVKKIEQKDLPSSKEKSDTVEAETKELTKEETSSEDSQD